LVTFETPQRGNKFPDHTENKAKRKKRKLLLMMAKPQILEKHMAEGGKLFFSSLLRTLIFNYLVVTVPTN